MNKYQRNLAERTMPEANKNPRYVAKIMSAMIRASKTDRAKKELLAMASTNPIVINHPDFII